MSSDFLLELRSEEIPARMQAGARVELEKLFRRELDAAGVEAGELTVWSTPRRLALIARGLPEATEAVTQELKGPPVGAPDQALDGFCRKAGVERGELEVREVKGRETYFAVKNIPGRATKDLLAEAIPAIIRDFSWPKSMRWGAASISTESLRWVRPLSGIVALLGDGVVECEVHGVTSGSVTLGHRFHHSGDITIGNADDYAMKLRAGHVIVDHEERQDLIRSGAAKVASEAGLKLVEDEGLVVENAGLTEWPVPLLGRFEEDFLEVPPETIQLTARVNQKYFVCVDAQGELANAFICTANIEAGDGGARVVDGNRKVLAARLSDARFFWDVDRKKTLAEHAKGLERITFHEKLGTVADKRMRLANMAREFCEERVVPNADADRAEYAALVCKADLVTEMVGEFPELQGLMGGYYARAEGLSDVEANAIRDHYKPVGQSDEVPSAPESIAVSLADKLDNLAAFFGIEEKPTGSKDPFALRRAAIGVSRLILENGLRFSLFKTVRELPILSPATDSFAIFERIYGEGFKDRLSREQTVEVDNQNLSTVASEVVQFIVDRLKVQQREAGVRHDLIDAVFALGGEDDLVRLLARVKALQSFMETEDGANLLAGYKRAANILKKEDWHGAEGEIARTGEEDPLALVDDPDMKAVIDAKMSERHAKELSYTPEPAEKALMDALDTSEPAASRAIEAEDFGAAMAALAGLRGPIDRFFEEVTVNADEENKRAHRLDLLARFRAAVHKVADFSRIEG
ncbi:glycine--tRNA ligase subunit beta [Qipengyuania sp. XHP0207]|uniref:glycine--tRNA ligase subunit beta n=1 Tax=Qipengyuania sp. XHP0207 TaxID=3038078 RepID=UPI00241FEE56|nr:glycine--tRNA ligase subunit beta [Qipengyuania sp. XHP0207]MDG5749395.1 glycine--tRNA ligase subunit beta [Qipengyuania sp. XHP0207]